MMQASSERAVKLIELGPSSVLYGLVCNLPPDLAIEISSMYSKKGWRVAVHGTGDGSGDGQLELPPDLLAHLGLAVGDALKLKIEDGVATLAPIARKAKKARQKKRV